MASKDQAIPVLPAMAKAVTVEGLAVLREEPGKPLHPPAAQQPPFNL
jgi:hypothetical protein